MTDSAHVAHPIDELWREHRSHLLNIAFRMVGNIGDAEDIVQDAFARLARVDLDEINDARGWLVVVVSRLCLDHLGAARVRREQQHGPDSAAFARSGDIPDPADRVTLDDNVRLALLVVLRQLSPAERTAFVLHEVFQYPFDTVADIVGRSPAACRQLASRARRRIEADAAGERSRFVIEPSDERRIAEEFVAACATGELDTLTRLLDPDVVGDVVLGRMTRPPLSGRADVGESLLRFLGGPSGATLVVEPVNGKLGVLAFRHRQLWALVQIETRAGLITDLHAIADPVLVGAAASQFDIAWRSDERTADSP